MVKRIVSALIFVPIVIILLILSQFYPIIINVLIAAVCVISIYEVFSAMGIYKMYGVIIPSVIFAGALPILGEGTYWQFAWFVYTVIIFCIMIFMNKVLSFKDIAVIYSMVMLITLTLSKIVTLRDGGAQHGPMVGIYYIVVALALPWMADTGAYFFGSFFGEHKLCPDISPKKTIEGLIGGVLACMVSMVLVNVVFQFFILPDGVTLHYGSMLLMALIGSILSVLGDLSFSLVKRGCHIKDFGNAIPGHGGILDRFDSVVFVAPFIYFFIKGMPLLTF